MRKITIFIVLALCIASVYMQEIKEENDVIILTEKNFDQVLKSNQYVLVKFYAPWCGHCKKLTPEFEKAAKTLKSNDPKIVLAKADATVEKELGTKFNVQGYPTLKFFINGDAIEYNGGRTDAEIVQWCNKKTGPSATQITTQEALEKFISDHDVAVVFFGQKDSTSFDTFQKFTKGYDDIVFAYTFDEAHKAHYTVSGDNNVVLFKKFDEKRNDCNCEFTQDALKQFVDSNSLQMIMDFDQKAAQKIFGENLACLFLFMGKDQKSVDAKKVLDDVAPKLRGKILMSASEINEGLGKRLGDYIGVKDTDLPSFRIVHPGGQDIKKFILNEEFTVENVMKFYEDFINNRLTSTLKSDPIPEKQDSAVYVVVGKSFEEVVLDETKDVLVKFYAPWCGHCKTMAPIYEKVAAAIKKDNPNILLAKFDATTNEVEGVNIQGFPTLKFYKATDKKNPVDFSGDRNEAGFYKFLKEHTTFDWVDPEGKTTAASDAKQAEDEKKPDL